MAQNITNALVHAMSQQPKMILPNEQQSIEKVCQNSMSNSSQDGSNGKVKSIDELLAILSDLNETAVELIVSDGYNSAMGHYGQKGDHLEDALEYLVKAEYAITVMLPEFQKTDTTTKTIEDTYISTIYFNLA